MATSGLQQNMILAIVMVAAIRIVIAPEDLVLQDFGEDGTFEDCLMTARTASATCAVAW
jgi:hypothetical protein